MVADEYILEQLPFVLLADHLPILSQLRLSLASLLPLAVPFYELTDAFVEVLLLFAVNGSSHFVSFVVI